MSTLRKALFISAVYLFCFQSVFSANEWIQFQNTNIEYMYVTQCRSWKESHLYCETIGGELASLTTESMRNFITNTVYDGTPNSGSCTSWNGAFVGGITDQVSQINWLDGTSTDFYDPLNVIDWDTAEDEPDHLSGHTIIGFKLSLSSRQWHTVSPADNNVQFCQRIVTAVPSKRLPTIVPTLQPTASPTIVPTFLPSLQPSILPTSEPTNVPTFLPTISPTIWPTVLPTLSPSATVISTNFPTATPSNLPSDIPTISPTAFPSEAVMSTQLPTVTPSSVPSDIPTIMPTVMPTIAPSDRARTTHNPSANPTANPTEYPIESTMETTLIPNTEKPTLAQTTLMDSETSTSVTSENVSESAESMATFYVLFLVVFGAIILFCCVPLCLVITCLLRKSKKDSAKNLSKVMGSKRTIPSVSRNGTLSPVSASSRTAGYQFSVNSAESKKQISVTMETNKLTMLKYKYSDTNSELKRDSQISAENMNVLKHWLTYEVELPQYLETFTMNGYDSMEIIKEMNAVSDLKEIGVTDSIHQNTIIKAINKLIEEESPQSPETLQTPYSPQTPEAGHGIVIKYGSDGDDEASADNNGIEIVYGSKCINDYPKITAENGEEAVEVAASPRRIMKGKHHKPQKTNLAGEGHFNFDVKNLK